MATPTEISVLLRLYTSKQKSPTVILSDFCDYLQKYSRHYLQETPELVMYLDDTVGVVKKEIEKLADESKVILSSDGKGKETIFVPYFYIDRMIQRYREIEEHIELPFPLAADLPSGFPGGLVKAVYITTDFTQLIDSGERSNNVINQLIFPDETPPIIFPGAFSPEKMLDLSLSKIRLFLRKDESRDYIQKRIMIANPGKELSTKNFLIQFQTRPSESMSAFKHSGDAYLFWSYFCSFARQDFAKKPEKTADEISLIQAVYITEYLNNYYKNRSQKDLQRETALKNLELAFQKPPYFFDMETISRFTDSHGVPLLGQYKDTDLETFIKEKTADNGTVSLPELLVFKTEAGGRYFILKNKVVPLVIKLCNDARKSIKESITTEWYKTLKEYGQEVAMKSQADFEKKLEGICRTRMPVLYAILTASFIPLLMMEGEDVNDQNGFRMFDHGRLLPLSVLFMLDRQELMTDARILLPFWYTLPVISTIIAFFRRPREPRETPKKTAKRVSDADDGSDKNAQETQQQKKAELRGAVARIEKKLIPAGSTLEQELSAQLDLWNRTLNPDMKNNLTEDVNSLVRDYIRRIIKTFRASTFDEKRVAALAETLVDTPALLKIKNRDALLSYVQLYIIQLIKNSK
jgi:hypothetical protein